ncbi:hypothetical protein ABZ387_37205 [Streptomyces flaveolus]|uniref:hypothetical protein n=1 Tax=Streptomyces flaveolus TaxID=67297 RepID=UPI0033C38235
MTTFNQLTRLRSDLARISPHLGGAVRSWSALTGCLGWPIPTRPVTAKTVSYVVRRTSRL